MKPEGCVDQNSAKTGLKRLDFDRLLGLSIVRNYLPRADHNAVAWNWRSRGDSSSAPLARISIKLGPANVHPIRADVLAKAKRSPTRGDSRRCCRRFRPGIGRHDAATATTHLRTQIIDSTSEKYVLTRWHGFFCKVSFCYDTVVHAPSLALQNHC